MAYIKSYLLAGLGLAIVAASGCTGHKQKPGEPARSHNLMTRESIRRSGAVDGWEAVQRGGTSLVLKESVRGDTRASHRGAHSLTLSTQVLLVVDETVMQDIAYLKQIPASNIESIRVMSAREGTVWYGTQAGNGVIVVTTDVFGDRTTDD